MGRVFGLEHTSVRLPAGVISVAAAAVRADAFLEKLKEGKEESETTISLTAPPGNMILRTRAAFLAFARFCARSLMCWKLLGRKRGAKISLFILSKV